MKKEYDFTLAIVGINELTPEIEDALYVSGCDDALLSVRHGRVFATFTRKAGSIIEAIATAVVDIRSADVGADVLRVDVCSLVTQSEIARRIERTRQNIHQYISGERGPGGFPPPACGVEEESMLWYWCEVAHWLWENGIIKEDEYLEAKVVDIINLILEGERLEESDPELAKEIRKAVEA